MNAFREGLKILVAAKPKFTLTKDQADIWEMLLSDVPPQALVAAAFKLARESSYEPDPASWRERALQITEDPRMTASEAWDEMYRNRHNRHFKVPAWSSEAVQRAAQSVQWDDPNWETQQIPTIRAQFERYYNSLKDKQETIDSVNETLALMPGVQALLDKTNARRQIGGGH